MKQMLLNQEKAVNTDCLAMTKTENSFITASNKIKGNDNYEEVIQHRNQWISEDESARCPLFLKREAGKTQRNLETAIMTLERKINQKENQIMVSSPISFEDNPRSPQKSPYAQHGLNESGETERTRNQPIMEGITNEFSRMNPQFHDDQRQPPTQTWTTRNFQPQQYNLPKVEVRLPEFHGVHAGYRSFVEHFALLVDKRQDISNLEKMLHLKSCLKGQALELIQSLPTLGEYYEEAKRMLDVVYDRKHAELPLLLDQWEKYCLPGESIPFQTKGLNELRCLIIRINQLSSIENDISMARSLVGKFPGRTKRHIAEWEFTMKNTSELRNIPLSHYINEIGNFLAKEEYTAVAFPDSGGKRWFKHEPERQRQQNIHVVMPKTPKEHNIQVVIPEQTLARKSPRSQKREYRRPRAENSHSEINKSSSAEVTACVFCGKHAKSTLCFTVKTGKERTNLALKQGRCVRCLQKGHGAKNFEVCCTICSGPHNIVLCYQLKPPRQPTGRVRAVNTLLESDESERKNFYHEERQNSPDQEEPPHQTNSENVTTAKSGSARLLIGDVNIQVSNRQEVRTSFLIDTGASITIISKQLALEHNLTKIGKRRCKVSGFGGKSDGSKLYDEFKITLVSKNFSIEGIALAHDEPITSPISVTSISDSDLAYIRRKNIVLADSYETDKKVVPQIIIGMDMLWKILQLEKPMKILPSGLKLMNTKFGHIAIGQQDSEKRKEIAYLFIENTIPSLELGMERFLGLDEMESGETEKELKSKELQAIDKHFENNILFENGRYTIRYYLKENISNLSENYNVSWKRLKANTLKLSKQKMLQEYDKVIRNHLDEKQIEEVKPGQIDGSHISYLPHQGVLRLDKPDKPIRVVFDASAKEKGRLSLNECMGTGRSFIEHIPRLLIRARAAEKLMTADIQAAFLQVGIHQDQRDLLRFLWLKDISKPVSNENVITYRFTSVPFGAAQSPYLLMSTINYHLKRELLQTNLTPERKTIVERVLANTYVDNLIIDVSEMNLWTVYNTIKEVFADMGMNAREFTCSTSTFTERIPEKDRGKTGDQKLLGVQWDNVEDKIKFNIDLGENFTNPTKRTMLSEFSSVFDPLGLLVPVMLPYKLFIQEIWKEKHGWDAPIQENKIKEWIQIKKNLNQIDLSIPRVTPFKGHIFLVAFSDASALALGAAVYAVTMKEPPILIMSKSKLAPSRIQHTIPKLELSGILLAAKLLEYVSNSISKCFMVSEVDYILFSDSVIALSWLHSDKQTSVYVKNRARKTKEILYRLATGEAGNENHTIRKIHVPGEENIADWTTRKIQPEYFLENKERWFGGPNWMTHDYCSKIGSENQPYFPQVIENENVIQTNSERVLEQIESSAFENDRISQWKKQIRVVFHCLRFISLLSTKVKTKSLQKKLSDFCPAITINSKLSSKGLHTAETVLWKTHQRAHMEQITSPGNTNLKLFLDDEGLWRTGNGRMNFSDCLSFDNKFPIFVPHREMNSTVAKLILHIHESLMHAGTQHTLNEIRAKYWIPRARNFISKILRKCVKCKKEHGRPFKYPPLPPLPEQRVNYSHPFGHVGIDTAGPFFVKTENSVNVKRYILLLTCLLTRAIHLEVMEDISAKTFLQAFRKFCARRGVPESIISDNAPSFKTVSPLLQGSEDECNDNTVNTYMATHRINWKFIPAHAPWQGGIYERLIGSVKTAMRKGIGRKILMEKEFETIVTEVEAIVNSRPLTEVPNEEEFIVIRPVDFWQPKIRSGLHLSQNSIEKDEDYIPNDASMNSKREIWRKIKDTNQYLEKIHKEWEKLIWCS